MNDYPTLKKKLQDFISLNVKLTTQMEELAKQEALELEQLKQLGITNIDQAKADATAELEQIRATVDSSLNTLEAGRSEYR